MNGHAAAPAAAGTFLPDVRSTRATIGGWAQLSVVQYFVAEAAVIEAWAGPEPYSRATGFISDLGAVSCGVYEDRAVCSPLHVLMNASFVVQGLALILGALFLTAGLLCVAARPGVSARRFHVAADDGPTRVLAKSWILAVAIRILTGISGVGTVIVGLVPEDFDSPWHFAGALMFFVGGGFALLLLGILWFRQTPMSWFIAACGSLCIGALVVGGLTAMDIPEPGTLERLMAYPVTIGLSAAGLVIAQRVHTERKALRARSGRASR